MDTDYYRILNININATEKEIKKSFRVLASIHHPDKNRGSKKSEETFKIILNAYETLIDSEKRALYDLEYRRLLLQRTPQFKQEYPRPSESNKKNKRNISFLKLKIIKFFYSEIIIEVISLLLIFGLIALIINLFNIFNKPEEYNQKKGFDNNQIINKPIDESKPININRHETGEINFKN